MPHFQLSSWQLPGYQNFPNINISLHNLHFITTQMCSDNPLFQVLLFALYINDLPSVLYVNNAEFPCSHSDLHVVETCLQSDSDAVATWLQSSRFICLNVDKSNYGQLLIGSQQIFSQRYHHVSFEWADCFWITRVPCATRTPKKINLTKGIATSLIV